MVMPTLTERGLAMQGFPTSIGKKGLRFTPSLSTLWIAAGTARASPEALLSFALVSAFGASRRRHPFDRLYRVATSEALPENPPPRRFAMALASAWAATTAMLFATRHRAAGFVAGALLATAAATVATTHFCVGSWIYRQGEGLFAVERQR
jgi:hypothetical protein